MSSRYPSASGGSSNVNAIRATVGRSGTLGPVPLGVYVHIPFCATRCDYCDFATWTDRAHLMDEYVDACVADLDRQMAERAPRATSVFFGGGTPVAPPGRRARADPRRDPSASHGAEVTVECNPDAVDPAKLEAFAAAGVNRLSLRGAVDGVRTCWPASVGPTIRPGSSARWARPGTRGSST